MTGSITQIRNGLAMSLKAIPGLRVEAVWPDTLNTPAALVRPMNGRFHEAMGSPGFSYLTFEIVILAAATAKGLKNGQELLDPYLEPSGPKSLKAAIERDITLGGVVTTLIVLGWQNYGSLAVADIEYLGAQLSVDVWP